MNGRHGQQSAPRLAPLWQGHEETKRLTATNAAADLDRLLRAIRQAGGVVVTVANGGQQENGNDPVETTSNQQVGSTASQPQAPPPGEESSLTLPRFCELAPEVRCMIWQEAINVPRLIYIHIGIPGTGTWSVFDRFILNMNYLAETESSLSSLFSTCRESRGEVLRATRAGPDPSRARWAAMLGLAQLRPTGSDLVYMGGLNGLGRTPPADTNKIIPLALVLGDILPWVMVNADIFVSYFNPDPSQQPGDPIDKALADLRALGNAYVPFFERGPNGLPRPRLPGRMVFMLDNFRLRWEIASPCATPGHREDFITSCCIHHDHLEIIADGDIDGWMVDLSQYDDRSSWRIRTEIVPAVRAIFAGWRGRPDAQVPQLSFACIRPSE